MLTPIVLSIAGHDPSSGAGVTADIKTAAAHGCYATTCITALTVQTTEKVFAVEPVREEIVRDTLYELVRDLPPAAVRVGMLANGAVANVVAEFLETVRPPNVVLDPVLRSSSGAALLDGRGEAVLRDRLLKLADLVTPNVEESQILQELTSGKIYSNRKFMAAELPALARRLHSLGCRALVITGGHLDEAADMLSVGPAETQQIEWFSAARIESQATHGTGCAFAMAIACNLAKGLVLREAVGRAKAFVRRAIETAEPLGHGHGPMNHLFRS
jgi:hydroxymethylpyrimidine/phosphomethylpyrimidine kinase